MGREYSKKRSSAAGSSSPNQLLVIIVTFLVGYFTAAVFDIETISHWVNTQLQAHHQSNTVPKTQQQTAIPPKPKFEFYTLLTNEKVPVSEKTTGSPAATNPATTASTVANGEAAVRAAAITTAVNSTYETNVSKVQRLSGLKTEEPKSVAPGTGKSAYSVQVASFKSRHDAEHMKGLLILKGFNVSIVPINHASRGIWFRVVVGPYANRTLAQKAQIDLAKNERLRGMLTAG